MDARDPFANENEITPTNMMNEQKTISIGFLALISPYPTVVIVVTVQYMETAYS